MRGPAGRAPDASDRARTSGGVVDRVMATLWALRGGGASTDAGLGTRHRAGHGADWGNRSAQNQWRRSWTAWVESRLPPHCAGLSSHRSVAHLGQQPKEIDMGTEKRIDAASDRLAGKAKEAAGKLTEDEKLEREGRLDQVKGAAKDVVEDVKDAAHKASDRVKEAFDR